MKNKNITRDNIKNIFGPSLQSEINKFTSESKNFNNKLYHYTRFEKLEKILKSRKLRLSHYKKLNDDMEIMHAIKLTLDNISEYAKCSKYRDFWNFFNETFKSLNIFDFYVCSFSDRYDNEYLWKNYGADSRGVCLAFCHEYFKPMYQAKKKNKKLISLERIHYNESEFNCYIRKIISSIEDKIKDNFPDFDSNNETIYKYLASEVAIFILPLLPKLKKRIGHNNHIWEKENEWRIYQIAYTKKFNATLPGRHRLDRPKLGKASIPLGLNDICEIWIGRSCCKNEVEKVQELIKKYKFKNVQIRQVPPASPSNDLRT